MARSPQNRNRPPLDAGALDQLALRYVGRYATTRAKLGTYLSRKLKERGWSGATPPPVDALVARMAAAGYVDDRAFAEARAGALARRGYGARRQADALRAAGVSAEDAGALHAGEPEEEREAAALTAATAFARRRRLGRFGAPPADRAAAQKQMAAMLRAGHDFATARAVLGARDDEEPD